MQKKSGVSGLWPGKCSLSQKWLRYGPVQHQVASYVQYKRGCISRISGGWVHKRFRFNAANFKCRWTVQGVRYVIQNKSKQYQYVICEICGPNLAELVLGGAETDVATKQSTENSWRDPDKTLRSRALRSKVTGRGGSEKIKSQGRNLKMIKLNLKNLK